MRREISTISWPICPWEASMMAWFRDSSSASLASISASTSSARFSSGLSAPALSERAAGRGGEGQVEGGGDELAQDAPALLPAREDTDLFQSVVLFEQHAAANGPAPA